MKTFKRLNQTQQKRAVNHCPTNILEGIIEGGIRFNDALNGDNLQARIDKAGDRAEAMGTPWFVHEYILDTCRADLTSMARAEAQDAEYTEDGEYMNVSYLVKVGE